MKVAGLEITRSKQPEQGSHGSASSYGKGFNELVAWGNGDPNPTLASMARFAVYDEMRRSSAAVRSALWMFKLPVRSAAWDFEPVSEDPIDQIVADACRWQFGLGDEEGQLDRSWEEQLQQALLMLDWGCQFEEDVWSPDAATFTDADGDQHLFWTLARCDQRAPHTIRRIHKDDATGHIAWLEQALLGTDPIPGYKLSPYVLEREGDDWFGTSVLRPMWGPWMLQKQLMAAVGIGWDSFGKKTPLIRHPEGQERKAESMGRDYRTNQRGYFTVAGAKPLPGTAGWDIELVGPDNPGDPVPLLNWYSQQIAVAGIQQFSSLGGSQHGSRAVGDVLVEPFSMACVAIAKQISSVKHRGAIRRFVDVNFGVNVPAPRLTASKVQMRGIDVLTAAISDLATAGLEFTDPDTQNDIRDQLNLPKLPDDIAVGIQKSIIAGQDLAAEGGLNPADQANIGNQQTAPTP